MDIRLTFEDKPPEIERVAVHPYPDLKRLWVRASLTPFDAYPNLDISVIGPDGEVEAEMSVIQNRDPYISLTMHLPNPIPHARYLARFVLSRDDKVLSEKEYPFDLVFREVEE